MFNWYKKEKPVQGLAGMGGGVVSKLLGGLSVSGAFTVGSTPYIVPGAGPWTVADGAYDSGLTAGPLTLTVDDGPFFVTCKVIGAGGSKGSQGSEHGGGGGGVLATIELKDGITYALVVGDGATGPNSQPKPIPYGGGGHGDYPLRGSGGGFSGIFVSSVIEANACIVAGGGGACGSYGGGAGGGGSMDTDGTAPANGDGGAGQPPLNPSNPNPGLDPPRGEGGTTNNGGLGPGGAGGSGQSQDPYPGPGISLQGGAGRGGGGGGYYGGGAGTDRGGHAPGGGGGSSYWGGHPNGPVTKLGNYGGANGWYPHPYFKGLGAYGMPQPAGGPHGVAGYGGGPKWTSPYTNDGYPGRIIIYRSGSEP